MKSKTDSQNQEFMEKELSCFPVLVKKKKKRDDIYLRTDPEISISCFYVSVLNRKKLNNNISNNNIFLYIFYIICRQARNLLK